MLLQDTEDFFNLWIFEPHDASSTEDKGWSLWCHVELCEKRLVDVFYEELDDEEGEREILKIKGNSSTWRNSGI
jgi:hypothetical protein